ncbi:MAG: hypothetical protein R2799_05835 [Crocinitomicaceae bacterium]
MKFAKTLFLLGGLALTIASCGGEDWPEDKVKEFKAECVKQLSSAAGDSADPVCDCVLEELKKEYKSYAEADKSVNENWMAEKMLSCMKESMGGGAAE